MDKGQQMRNAGLSIIELSSEWDFVSIGFTTANAVVKCAKYQYEYLMEYE